MSSDELVMPAESAEFILSNAKSVNVNLIAVEKLALKVGYSNKVYFILNKS